jgi:di/tricarboxylate transporter
LDIWIVSIILVGTLVLFITEKIPVALTAIGIMVTLVVCKVLEPQESVAGLAHPAVVTIGAMFLISKGLVRTGSVEYIARRIIRLTRGNPGLATISILSVVAVASAFINNTPIVILFIPVVMTMCCEFNLSPSRFLIPVSYASILGGTCTLIGTSTNIIVSDLSAQHGIEPISFFELSIVGIPIAIVGILFLIAAAPKLMPALANPVCQIQDSENRKYLAELKIPRGSNFLGEEPVALFREKYPDVLVLELVRYSHIFHPSRDSVSIAADDILLVKGSVNDLVGIINQEDVYLPSSEKGLSFGVAKNESLVVEIIITSQSSMLGQRLIETRLMKDPDIHVIAIKRSNLHFTEKQVRDVKLKNGDMVLVWCFSDKLADMRAEKDYLIVEDVYEEIIHKRKTWIATSIFVGMIVFAAFGWADIMICALTAAFLMVFTGCLQMRDAYRALQGNILLLIAGTIALGAAMEKTGASQLYAEFFVSMFSGLSPGFILGGMILLTSISTQILSNNATAVLMVPIAVSTAIGIGVDPKPFIIGICFGASACFATPIGYQTNLLVYTPGGYRFSDYLKMGIPLNLLVLILATLLIPVFWHF